MKGSAVTHGWR